MEFFKVLIDFAKEHRRLRELLVLVALLGALGSAYLWVVQHQEAMSLARSGAAQAIVLAVAGGWIATVLWRMPAAQTAPPLPDLGADVATPARRLGVTGQTALRIVSALVMLTACAGAVYLYASSRFAPIGVHVVFDYPVQSHELGILAETLNSSNLLEAKLDDRITFAYPTGRNGSVTLDDARRALGGLGKIQRAREDGAVPIYVTSHVLSDKKWDRLLLITAPDLIVISASFLNEADRTIGTEIGRRYVASSIALEAVHAAAKRRGRVLLEREPGVYRGCMFDFFEQVDDYIQRTQKPKLCPLEITAIDNVLGRTARDALAETLQRISEMH
jgi:hypothetical protein